MIGRRCVAGTSARKNLQDFKASLQRKTTPQIDWYESSQEVLAVKHRGELVELASRYITTARKNLHDVSSELRGRHRQSSQSEPSIALQCLPRLVWGERIRQWCFKDTGGRSTARSGGVDDDVFVSHW